MIKEKKIHNFILIFFSLSLLLALSQVSADEQEFINRSEIENYLKTAKVVSFVVISSGRTRAWDVMLDDDKIKRKARFKHIYTPRPENIIADSYTYEIAAYELDKLLGLEVMPPIVEREIKKIKGSLQFFIEDCFSLDEKQRKKIKPPDEEKFQDELAQITIFENLTYNKRVIKDVLIHKADWKVCRVDFSQAFAPMHELFPDFEASRCSKKLYDNLKKLDQKTIESKLGDYLYVEEIDALLTRKRLIIEKIEELIKQKNEKAVLF
jgi:hypothetical protein